tara:strand:+ start:383 stop:745 length:363 start_codon:yes stop_codon:yes gene_type:complete
MAHFAELDNINVVKRVLVVDNNMILKDGVENEQQGIDYLVSIFGSGWWKQTSYNGSFRKNYAGEGMYYDPVKDAFIPPKPAQFPSWVFDEDICRWLAPTVKPDDGKAYLWDEANTKWVEF